MVITSCRWVHTVGMRFALDVAYVDAADTVVKIVRMVPHRVGWPVTQASWVIEAEAGAFERWGLHVGDVVELRTVDVAADADDGPDDGADDGADDGSAVVDDADDADERRPDRPSGG